MNRRQTLADARTALAVRQVQERAALMRLQLQRQAEDVARAALEDKQRIQNDSEAAWSASLGQATFDPFAEALWRSQAQSAAGEVLVADRELGAQLETSRTRLEDWRSGRRSVDAAARVESTAARQAARQAETRRLDLAEDAGHARRAAS